MSKKQEKSDREKEEAINEYFAIFASNGNGVPQSLENVLNNYLIEQRNSQRPGPPQAQEEIFEEETRQTRHRGFIQFKYFPESNRNPNLKKCLQITHVLIVPRGGNILDTVLRNVLNNPNNSDLLDSIQIQSILDSGAQLHFGKKNWTPENASSNTYILKKEAAAHAAEAEGEGEGDKKSVHAAAFEKAEAEAEAKLGGKRKSYKKIKISRRRNKSNQSRRRKSSRLFNYFYFGSKL